MKYEIEVISNELLPAIRSIMATRMKTEYGLKQREIANKLNLTQPAVSQYLGQNRADKKIISKLKEDPQTDILIDQAVDNAVNNKDYTTQIGQIIDTVRDKGIINEELKGTEKIL